MSEVLVRGVTATVGALIVAAVTADDTVDTWLADRGVPAAAITVLRTIVVGGAGYVLAVATVGTVAALARSAHLGRVADGLTPRRLRGLVARAAGSGLLASIALPAATVADPGGNGAGAGAPPGTAVLQELPPEAEVPTDLELTPDDPPTTTTTAVPSSPPPVVETAPAAPEAADEWTVAPGESFWVIASELLAEAWGRKPADAEVVTYWRVLIDANRDRLTIPGNADLIYPGQKLVVPSIT